MLLLLYVYIPQPKPQSSQPIQQPSQVQLTKEIQTQTSVLNEDHFICFSIKNKDQRYLKPMNKQQLSELRQQDKIRKGSKVLTANRYNKKEIYL